MIIGETRPSWSFIFVHLFLIGLGIGLYYIVPTAGINECRSSDERWIVALMGSISLFYGLFGLARHLFIKTSWTETHVRQTTLFGRHEGIWSEIDQVDFSTLSDRVTVKFDNGTTIRVHKYRGNSAAFLAAVDMHYARRKPWRVMQPAFRMFVESSTQCGCLQCGAIFATQAIQDWDRVDSKADDPDDIAVCSNCASAEALVCDNGEVAMSQDNLRKILSEMDEDLPQQERERRSRLRKHHGFIL